MSLALWPSTLSCPVSLQLLSASPSPAPAWTLVAQCQLLPRFGLLLITPMWWSRHPTQAQLLIASLSSPASFPAISARAFYPLTERNYKLISSPHPQPFLTSNYLIMLVFITLWHVLYFPVEMRNYSQFKYISCMKNVHYLPSLVFSKAWDIC